MAAAPSQMWPPVHQPPLHTLPSPSLLLSLPHLSHLPHIILSYPPTHVHHLPIPFSYTTSHITPRHSHTHTHTHTHTHCHLHHLPTHTPHSSHPATISHTHVYTLPPTHLPTQTLHPSSHPSPLPPPRPTTVKASRSAMTEVRSVRTLSRSASPPTPAPPACALCRMLRRWFPSKTPRDSSLASSRDLAIHDRGVCVCAYVQVCEGDE